HSDLTRCMCVVQTVLQQIQEQLVQALWITKDGGIYGGQLRGKFQPGVFKTRLHHHDQFLQQFQQVTGLFTVGQCPNICQRKIIKIIHQIGQATRLLLQASQCLLIEGAHTILQCFDVGLKHSERRAQLVGDVSHPPSPRLFALLQGVAQVVEVLCQRGKFILPFEVNLVVVVTLAQPFDVLHQCVNSLGKEMRQGQGGQQRKQKCGNGDQCQIGGLIPGKFCI